MQLRLCLLTTTTLCIAAILLMLSSRQSTTSVVDTPERRQALYQFPTSAPLCHDDEAPLHICYEAPLHNCKLPDRIPGSYCVFLNIDYTLQQHKQVVSHHVDLDSAITHTFPETERHGLYYCGHLKDAGLNAVRADLGVDMVECSLKGFLIE